MYRYLINTESGMVTLALFADIAIVSNSVNVVTNANRLRKVNIHPDYLKQGSEN